MNEKNSPRQRRPYQLLWLATLLLTGMVTQSPAAQTVGVELNRLESIPDGCRAYLVFRNEAKQTFERLQLDLVIFDSAGIISRRLAVDASPLRGGKTSVKVFDIEGVACDAIGRVLLNDVLECQIDGERQTDCVERMRASSRAEVPLVK
ncbi:MAG: Tat pathway signal sequence domain protein [Ectothiorhodospiraceae bacterium]|jgi:hypothetical protein